MDLKAYGYLSGAKNLETPMRLSEVTIVADATLLRHLAGFLIHAADSMEQLGESFGHQHFADYCGGLPEGATDVIAHR